MFERSCRQRKLYGEFTQPMCNTIAFSVRERDNGEMQPATVTYIHFEKRRAERARATKHLRGREGGHHHHARNARPGRAATQSRRGGARPGEIILQFEDGVRRGRVLAKGGIPIWRKQELQLLQLLALINSFSFRISAIPSMLASGLRRNRLNLNAFLLPPILIVNTHTLLVGDYVLS